MLEPNGALRTVSYIADERGFNPIVSYSYGHPQSSVTVTSAAGPAAILQQQGGYAPAFVSDKRLQIVDKSNIYAAPPPALDYNAFNFALPGPSVPVVVPQPLRQVAPVIKAAAAITTNYAPAYVPPPAAYLPPPAAAFAVAAPPPPVAVAVAAPPPPLIQYAPQPPAIAVPVPQPQVFLKAAPIAVAKVPKIAKYLTVPAPLAVTKVVKTQPAVAVVQDSYAAPPRDTFRDPDAPSYPDSVKITEPTPEYGPPAYVPPPVIAEEPVKVKVVEPPPVKVFHQPVIQQQIVALPPPPPPPAIQVQKVVAVPPPAIAVQKVVAAPPPQVVLNPGLYAGAIGFHTHTAHPDSYIHAYGTQGFQVTTSRKFNKAFFTPKIVAPKAVYGPPAIAVQKVVQPAPVYGPPAIAVQKVVEPVPVYGPPAVPVQKVTSTYLPPPPPAFVQPAPVYGPPPVRVVKPKPVYGPPPEVSVFHQQIAVAPPPPPLPVFQEVIAAPPPVVAYSPPPQFAVAAPVTKVVAAAPVLPAAPLLQAAPVLQAAPPAIAIKGKKQNPLTFAYSYDQGGAKVTHSYSGSGW